MEESERTLIVLLGEGNFSFAILLAKQLKNDLDLANKFDLIASDYAHNDENLKIDPIIKQNIAKLEEIGIPVWLDLDATKLESHQKLNDYLQICIYREVHFIFNFPHVHNVKMKINLNRDLLRDCFISLEKLAKSKFCPERLFVHLSLCHGQCGMVELDQFRSRAWNDSWQLPEMAAFGNFVLTNVQPFRMESFLRLINVNSNNLELDQNLFIHNLKTFSERSLTKTLIYDNPEKLPDIEYDLNLFEPFGYRLQNKPFNKVSNDGDELGTKFRGGNIFTLERREDVLDTLSAYLINHGNYKRNSVYKSIIDEFLNDICSSLFKNEEKKIVRFDFDENCIKIVMTSNFNNFTGFMESIIEYLIFREEVDEVMGMSSMIRYQKQQQNDKARTDCFLISVKNPFGFFSDCTNEINLNVDVCLQIRWRIKIIGILASNYLTILRSQFNHSRILSTRVLYPRNYIRDISFWYEISSNENHGCFDSETFPTFVETILFGGSSSSTLMINVLSLIDCFVKSPNKTMSYCYRVSIQSLDLALNKSKVTKIMEILGQQFSKQFSGVTMR